MISTQHLRRLGAALYELPIGAVPGMRVPGKVFINEALLEDLAEDRSLEQLANTATLPGVVKFVAAMPDIHEGYGFPIGGVAATELPHGVISPGGVGYDINCGVRVLLSDLSADDVGDRMGDLGSQLMRAIPSGTGRGGRIRLDSNELNRVLRYGVGYCVERGWAAQNDTEYLEEHGCLTGADPTHVSDRAKKRGMDQLGTLGSGNHFLEVQKVDEIFDEEAGKAFGLFPGQIVVAIHCGSRGLGHQVCTDYVRRMLSSLNMNRIELPDRELACAPADSAEGSEYLSAMACAANFAWANRQVIQHHVRIEWQALFGAARGLRTLYDVCHNIAKRETHILDGKSVELLVHRKGATRAFGPGHPDVPEAYRSVGQPVLIPGTMGTASYILKGAAEAMEASFGTCCHGAGRRLSRTAAKREVEGESLRQELEAQGIAVRCFSARGLAEEAPLAYKNVEDVIDVVETAGLARRVARVRPVAVIKGE